MSKASNRWVRDRYYTLMGLEAPTDNNLLDHNDNYIMDFLVPATYMVSGKTKEEFEFDKVKAPDAAALKYLSSCASAEQLNQLISILHHMWDAPVWMMFLKDLIPFYTYNGLLSSSVQEAVNKYMETHAIRYATYDVDACDIMLVIDLNSGDPIEGYPKDAYLYEDFEVSHYGIKHGTSTVIEVCEKPWYQYDEHDKHLIDNVPFDVSQLLYEFKTPNYDEKSGEVFEGSYTYLSVDKPPAEIAELYHFLPEPLVADYGDPVSALAAYVKNNPGQLSTQEAMNYLSNYDKICESRQDGGVSWGATNVKLPDTMMIGDAAIDAELAKLGYEVKDGGEIIREYCKEQSLDEGITVRDLLDYMSDEKGEFNPVPFDKEAYKKEVLNGIDWDKVAADAVACVDAAAIVKEELTKIGVDPETLARINIAMSTNSQVDISPTNYIDRFEEAGAIMLHGVRELLSKDASLENRQRVQDVIYAYLVIMMGEEKKLPTVIQFTADKRDNAQGDAKVLIEKAMEVLRK